MIERYSTEQMSAVWSDDARFARWTQMEMAACEVWCERGAIEKNELAQIQKAKPPSSARVKEIETVTHHDVVAFVQALSEQIGEPACRHVHRGLTSSDVVDTALALALRQSLDVLLKALVSLQAHVGYIALQHKHTPCIARTHGIHAEPSTFGLRLANWHTEIERNVRRLNRAKEDIQVAKLSGAVGHFSQTDPAFEKAVLARVGLKPEPIATQVVPRDRHASVLCALGLLASGLERFATEIRSLQRTEVQEVAEPFGKGQTGSSAMPHKRNPILTERICGLSRVVRSFVQVGLENIALWHERDISHSSAERVVLADAFHLSHYMVELFARVIKGLQVFPKNMEKNLFATKGLVFSQKVLHALIEKGMAREDAYRVVQSAAKKVWQQSTTDAQTDFQAALKEEQKVQQLLPDSELSACFALEPFFTHVDALFERAGL